MEYWIHTSNMGNRSLFFFVIVMLAIFSAVFSSYPATAAVRDSDFDGLSDTAEQTVYMTDPHVADTDGDGISDGAEVIAGTNPLDATSSQLSTLSKPDPGILGDPMKFSWYVGRASGILSFILLSLGVCFGLLMSSRFMTRLFLPATIYETHRFLSFSALVAVIVHATSFMFDNFFRMTLLEALVPFFLQRDYQTTLGFDIGKTVALGTIALYFMLLLILTSEFRSKMPLKLWRATHYTSFIAYLLFIGHGFASGTDSREWWMQAIYIVSAVSVFGLILFRIFFRNIMPKVRARRSTLAPKESIASQHLEAID
jgi:hypothetical protein